MAVQGVCLSKQTFQTWKTISSRHLDRSALKRLRSLMLDIIAVDLAIKPAYLYDVGAPNSEKLLSFVRNLKQEGLIYNQLNVLRIGMDCLVVNSEEVSAMCSKQLGSICLINVSSHLKSGPVLHENHDDILALLDIGKVIPSDNISGHNQVFDVFTGENSFNVSSLFGFLLNYPLIYWFDQGSGMEGNCLSMEKLTVVKAFAKYTCENLGRGSGVVGPTGTFEHCLYSYSYPSCLHAMAADRVTDWFSNLEKIVNKSIFFFDARLVIEEKILEVVSL